MLASLLKKVKTDEALTEEDRLGVWGGYFLGTDVGVEIMEALAVKDPIFQELRNTEEDYWQRPEARYFLLRERLAEMDRMAEIDDARTEGEARGRTEGEHDKAIEIAKRMLRKGRTPEIVAEDVELPVEEIRSLNL
jgi:predicted transposase/invertase (TIGR01784 family)